MYSLTPSRGPEPALPVVLGQKQELTNSTTLDDPTCHYTPGARGARLKQESTNSATLDDPTRNC